MICPNCGEEIPSDLGITWGDACPFCMTTLEEDPKKNGVSGSVTLGDANAISGGIHHTESHNVDSHNVTHITNTYVQENKDKESLLAENKLKFRELCKKVIKPGGRLSPEGKESLEDSRWQFGLDAATANSIIDEVKKSLTRAAVSTLSMLDRMTLNNAKNAVAANSKNAGLVLKKLGPLAESCNEEEVKFYYYLLLAAKDPLCCIQQYESRKADNYWQTYWSYRAYSKEGDIAGAQRTLIALKAWPDMPEYNQLLLGAAGDYNELVGNQEAIEEMLLYLAGENIDYSDLLHDFQEAISGLYAGTASDSDFYLANFDLKVIKKDSAEKEQTAQTPPPQQQDPQSSIQRLEDNALSDTRKPAEETKKTLDKKKTITEILSGYRDQSGDLRELTDAEAGEAFEELSRISALGNPEALFFLGQMYITGKGVTTDARKGADLFKQSSAKGFASASIALGACYLYGIGVKKDISEADKRLRNAMNSKNPEIIKAIGDLFTEKGSKAQADFWYKKAADLGNVAAKDALSEKNEVVDTDQQASPTVKFSNIHLDGNADWDGVKGLWVYFSWVIDNLKDNRVMLAANFFWALGPKVLAGNSSFKSPDGQLSTKEETEPLPYDSTAYTDFRLFMPYDEMPTKREGTFHMKLSIEASHFVDFKRTVIGYSVDHFFDVIVAGGSCSIKEV